MIYLFTSQLLSFVAHFLSFNTKMVITLIWVPFILEIGVHEHVPQIRMSAQESVDPANTGFETWDDAACFESLNSDVLPSESDSIVEILDTPVHQGHLQFWSEDGLCPATPWVLLIGSFYYMSSISAHIIGSFPFLRRPGLLLDLCIFVANALANSTHFRTWCLQFYHIWAVHDSVVAKKFEGS